MKASKDTILKPEVLCTLQSHKDIVETSRSDPGTHQLCDQLLTLDQPISLFVMSNNAFQDPPGLLRSWLSDVSVIWHNARTLGVSDNSSSALKLQKASSFLESFPGGGGGNRRA